jgi:hypothetical protein
MHADQLNLGRFVVHGEQKLTSRDKVVTDVLSIRGVSWQRTEPVVGGRDCAFEKKNGEIEAQAICTTVCTFKFKKLLSRDASPSLSTTSRLSNSPLSSIVLC